MKTVLVTGAAGFIGSHLVSALGAAGLAVRAAIRGPVTRPAELETVAVGEIDEGTRWDSAMHQVDVVVHLAGRVPDRGGRPAPTPSDFHRTNVLGTEGLLRAAGDAGVRRVVLVSTIKIHGENSPPDAPFRASDRLTVPSDPYARSKWEAEERLRALAKSNTVEAVVVRPPVVYGPRMRGNLLSLFRLIDAGLPLPVGAIRNARSFVFVGNLVDLLVRSVLNAGAAGRTFLVSDGPPLSTPALVRAVAEALDRPARIVPVHPALLRLTGRITRKKGSMNRLLDSLAVDDEATRVILEWSPRYSWEEGLAETARWYRRGYGEVTW